MTNKWALQIIVFIGVLFSVFDKPVVGISLALCACSFYLIDSKKES